MTDEPEHNHSTRNIQEPGRCPACDVYHEAHKKPVRPDLPLAGVPLEGDDVVG